MTKMFIPSLGTEIILEQDWSFDLFNEDRNATLIDMLGIKYAPTSSWAARVQQSEPVTIPAGTLLKVDRIYIRAGQKSYNSVTFTMPGKQSKGILNRWGNWRPKNIPTRTVRFWAKLADVNTLVFKDDLLTAPQKLFVKEFTKLAVRKTSPQKALNQTAEYILQFMTDHGVANVVFDALNIEELNPMYVALALRATSSVQYEIPSWQQTLDTVRKQLNAIKPGLEQDVLYGMIIQD